MVSSVSLYDRARFASCSRPCLCLPPKNSTRYSLSSSSGGGHSPSVEAIISMCRVNCLRMQQKSAVRCLCVYMRLPLLFRLVGGMRFSVSQRKRFVRGIPNHFDSCAEENSSFFIIRPTFFCITMIFRKPFYHGSVVCASDHNPIPNVYLCALYRERTLTMGRYLRTLSQTFLYKGGRRAFKKNQTESAPDTPVSQKARRPERLSSFYETVPSCSWGTESSHDR